MSVRCSSLLAMSAVAATCMLSMTVKGQQAGKDGQERSSELTAKLKEMQEASTKIVSVLKAEYKAGNIGFPWLQEAQHNLLEIELRLANTPADRMKILSQQLEFAKKAEALIAAEYKTGSASQIEVLQAQIGRIEIEIAMLEDVAPLHPGGGQPEPYSVPSPAANEDAAESDRGGTLPELQLVDEATVTIKDVIIEQVDEDAGTMSVGFGKEKSTKLINVPLKKGVRVVASHVRPGSVNHLPFEWQYLRRLEGKNVSIRLHVASTGMSIISIASGND